MVMRQAESLSTGVSARLPQAKATLTFSLFGSDGDSTILVYATIDVEKLIKITECVKEICASRRYTKAVHYCTITTNCSVTRHDAL